MKPTNLHHAAISNPPSRADPIPHLRYRAFPLTDPAVQISRSGFLKYDSPYWPKDE